MSIEPELRRVKDALERHGLLLLQDPTLASVATLVARAPVKGSWWGHPKGEAIFHVLEALEDLLFTKLVAEKVTIVHPRLADAVIAIGESRGRWQTEGLGAGAKKLLAVVRDRGAVRLDEVDGLGKGRGAAANELERRLLVCSEQSHTESGKHVRTLSTWAVVRDRFGREASSGPPIAEAKLAIELAVTSLGAENPRDLLPWS